MIRSAWFPDPRHAPDWGERIVELFRRHESSIGSSAGGRELTSQEVLDVLAPDLRAEGFTIERRKLASPGLPGLGRDQFDVFHPVWLCCLAIETGFHARAAKDQPVVEPLLVFDVDTLCLALPNANRVDPSSGQDGVAAFDRARELALTVYAHTRVKLPYRLLLIGF